MKTKYSTLLVFIISLLILTLFESNAVWPRAAQAQVVAVRNDLLEVSHPGSENTALIPNAQAESILDITPGITLPVPRAHHTATRLADGRILLAGGSQAPDQHLAEVAIFNPATGSLTQAAPLHTPRHDHSATLLRDGRVLVIGGYNLRQQWLGDAEVYDPATNTWTVVPPLYPHGTIHTATLLKDGRVLVVGGCIGSGVCTKRVEIFNPSTNTWIEATPLASDRAGHTALRLDDGRVLVAGGGTASGVPAGGDALLYNPHTNSWAATGPMVKPSRFASMLRLPDGRILVAGGIPVKEQSALQTTANVEIYQPTSNTWTAAASLAQARYAFTLALLANGQAMAVGGARDWDSQWTENSFVREIEVYDPAANRWRIAGELPRPRAFAASTQLPDGRWWVSGGQAGQTGATFWADTWLIQHHHSIWHVATNGSDVTGDGSVTKPFATIQHGIDVASSSNTVLVHPGRYKENIKFKGKNIVVGSLFVTTGNKNYIAQTIIDGNRAGRVVTFENSENANAVLSGLTLTNGYIQGSGTAGSGGGLACFNANPTLTHLVVSGNQVTAEGGGLYFSYCSSKLEDTLITNNTAFAGGGIRYSYGSPNLENVTITHNTTQGDGAGIQFYHAEASVKNTLIAHNAGGGKGGGLMFDGCSPSFTNVTIMGNTTTGHGGGLNVSFASNPTLANSIVWGNSPEQIYFDTAWPGEAVTIQYSDVQGGAAGIVTNGQGPVNWGTGNLVTDPRFVGGSDYHLAPTSPAIGAGILANAPTNDLDGNPRPNPAGSNPDLGAYEHPLGSPQPLSTLQGNIYLESRGSGHYTDTQVVLIGSRQTYTATTGPDGNFALPHLYADTYTLQASHPLFVRAQRTVIVSTASPQTLPEIGLWAGDIDQNQKVNLYDWYLLAAAIFPVSHPRFDINDDGVTNLKDLAILTLNLGRPNMISTNPPLRPDVASLNLSQPLLTAQSQGQLKLVPFGANEMILRLEEVGEPVYAVGTQVALPNGATVTEVEVSPAFAGGFLEWHQAGSTLYLVAAPPEERAITQNTEVAVIGGVTFVAGQTEVAAANSITTGPSSEIFLPLIIKE